MPKTTPQSQPRNSNFISKIHFDSVTHCQLVTSGEYKTLPYNPAEQQFRSEFHQYFSIKIVWKDLEAMPPMPLYGRALCPPKLAISPILPNFAILISFPKFFRFHNALSVRGVGRGSSPPKLIALPILPNLATHSRPDFFSLPPLQSYCAIQFVPDFSNTSPPPFSL